MLDVLASVPDEVFLALLRRHLVLLNEIIKSELHQIVLFCNLLRWKVHAKQSVDGINLIAGRFLHFERPWLSSHETIGNRLPFRYKYSAAATGAAVFCICLGFLVCIMI